MIGQRLGPYEVLSKVGEGGMGEVYRARDARLGRDVAIKVLPTSMSADPDRLRRFELEARAAAALNHPGILAVFDIGTDAGAPHIVSELLEGETLRARLGSGRQTNSRTPHATDADAPGGPLSVRRAVDYARQIAKGLSAAHEKGIVHRDLKPENIFVTTDGRVKILDFGLAKLTEPKPVPRAADETLVPATRATDAGTVLGTMGYMAPEQLRAQPVDHRADIFAFGAVLYEMLSGQRAFRGDTAADTISAVLEKDPADLSSVGSRIPPALARVVERCLEKNPAARFQSTHDLAFALESISTQSDSGAAAASVVGALPARGVRSRERLAWAALAGILLLALVASGVAQFNRPTVSAPLIRFTIHPPDDVSLVVNQGTVTVSPDARRIAYVARRGANGAPMLWVQAFNADSAQLLPGTENALFPFWSPDGQSLGFFAEDKLKTVSISGAAPQIVCSLTDGQTGGTWGPGGDIVFGSINGGLLRVPATGGQPTPLTTLDVARGEVGHHRPTFLPDGRHFTFAVQPGGHFFVGSLDAPSRTPLLDSDSQVIYSSKHLLFARDRTLFAQPFDVNTLTLSGEPLPVAQELFVNPSSAGASFSAAETGLLAFEVGQGPGSGRFPMRLTWFDRTGKALGTVGDETDDRSIELSPDGRWLTEHVHEAVGGGDIWLRDLARGATSRLSFGGHNTSAVWSPDGSRVVFASNLPSSGKPSPDPQAPTFNLFTRPADGGGEPVRILDTVAAGIQTLWGLATSWSPDGQLILFDLISTETRHDIWALPSSGDRKPRPWLQTNFSETGAQISPDGRWVAYESDETRRREVYVRPLSGNGKWRISTSGGRYERWSRDGKELFYISPDRKLMAVPIESRGGVLEAGSPQALFDLHLATPFTAGVNARASSGAPYAVSADGRFLVLVDASPPAVIKPISVVVNWTEGVKK